MASSAISAFGTLLQIGDGASPTENFATVAELRTISGPTLNADTIDVTTHNTATPFRRFISGLIDGGDVTFDINFIPQDPSHSYSAGILKDVVNRTARNIKIVFPDSGNTEWVIPVVFVNFEVSSDPADVLMASITAKVTGPPTFA